MSPKIEFKCQKDCCTTTFLSRDHHLRVRLHLQQLQSPSAEPVNDQTMRYWGLPRSKGLIYISRVVSVWIQGPGTGIFWYNSFSGDCPSPSISTVWSRSKAPKCSDCAPPARVHPQQRDGFRGAVESLNSCWFISGHRLSGFQWQGATWHWQWNQWTIYRITSRITPQVLAQELRLRVPTLWAGKQHLELPSLTGKNTSPSLKIRDDK